MNMKVNKMKYRTKAILYTTIGLLITFFFFRPLFDIGAYGAPIYRVENSYQTEINDLPPEILENPDFMNNIDKTAGRIFGFALALLPMTLGLMYGRRNWRNAKIAKETCINCTIPAIIGLFFIVIFLSGFTIIGKGEAAIAMTHDPLDFVPTSWNEFVAIKNGQISAAEATLMDSGIHWKNPLTTIVKFGLYEEFIVEIPLVLPVYELVRDIQGNVIDTAVDDLGNPIVTKYIFYTTEGIKTYSPATWTKLRYNPTFDLEVLTAKIEGTYDVIDLTQYASIVEDSSTIKQEWIENYGYYGEIVNPPTAKERFEQMYFRHLCTIYILEIKIPTMFTQLAKDNPNFSDQEIAVILAYMLIEKPWYLLGPFSAVTGDIPDIYTFLRDPQIQEAINLDLEGYFGIHINRPLLTTVYTDVL